ncbi:17beta-estradiol 17-dehydrogenase / 3alpha(17beta)-hydroxysteroid dehydrogenase (NAD+) [Fistulifera solaris]|uniref:17beta-estradiol 17-dehydrogenase / 3alpha(17beta)-hydroxysteroid dehydrogenase (NAD+) n=1 Tax=Fistulifera solaris TaxID=1519565 RepID=A0A1Z5KSE2_FISSO|nr:17beta-estradiol 17-dehydrogenase / 3alpha(17beta)-hydroxysteroid dehydrogenase (NAD+) [Fistulifera solaris]|eukprot:GAX28911.1 17beta-estradiol 17-dehydrogenase / 3alpha(17beta)-hydroxysteroid dehydrogenase (NAD+) [Fistulifera solaris]
MPKHNFQPPGAFLQEINSLIHQEPFESILYCVYWSVVIGVCSPIAILLLQLRLLFRLLGWILDSVRKYSACDPKGHPTRESAVVITGCDTGFGRDVALRAAEAGYIVFAGCLKEESVTERNQLSNNIKAFTMNVTNDEHVEKAAQMVSRWLDETTTQQRILHALINMAGVGFCGNVDFMPLNLFQTSMDVNFFGTVRCCKAFLPIFKSQATSNTYNDARILNIVSMAGLVPTSVGTSAYAASKYAVQGFSTAFRLEAMGFGIQVATINPSFHETNIVTGLSTQVEKLCADLPGAKREEYGEEFLEWLLTQTRIPLLVSWRAENVVQQTMNCLMNRSIPSEVVVGSDAKFVLVTLRIFPAWFRDILFRIDSLRYAVPASMRRMKAKSD